MITLSILLVISVVANIALILNRQGSDYWKDLAFSRQDKINHLVVMLDKVKWKAEETERRARLTPEVKHSIKPMRMPALEALIIKPRELVEARFIAYVPGVGDKVTHFKLGLGPCGKVVSKLTIRYLSHATVIEQTCEDGEIKEFLYRNDDIKGRVALTYRTH